MDDLADDGATPRPAPVPAPMPAPAPSPLPGPGSTPGGFPSVDALAAYDEDSDRFTAVSSVGIQQDPARAAKLIALQARTGLPTAVIDRNLAEVETAARRRDFNPEAFLRQSPGVASWLAEDPARVGLTRDDLPKWAAIEQLVRSSPDYRYAPDGSILEINPTSGYANRFASPLGLRAELVRRGVHLALAQQEMEQHQQALHDRYGSAANLGAGIEGVIYGAIQAGHVLAGADTSAVREQAGDIAAASQALSPGLWGDIQRGVGGLIAQIPLMVAGGPIAKVTQTLATGVGAMAEARVLSPILARVLTGAATMQPLALQGALQKADQEGAGAGLASWAIDSGLAGAFGPVGAGRIAAQVAGVDIPAEVGKSGAQILLKHIGLSVGQLEAFDLAHRIQDVATGADPHALDPDQLGKSLIVQGILGTAMGGTAAAPEAAEAARRMQDVLGLQKINAISSALHHADTLRAIGEQAHDTQAMALNQDATKGLLQHLADHGTYETLYVDATAWRDHFAAPAPKTEGEATAAILDPRRAAQDATGDALAYDKALSSDGQIAVPFKNFVGMLGDQAHRDWLTQEARTAPEAMNAREAIEQATAASKVAERDAAAATSGPDAERASSADLVHEDVKRQLIEAGTSESVAEAQASLWRQFMHTAAERGYSKLSPFDLYQEMRVNIARAFESGPAKDAIDAVVARLKAGDIPSEKEAADTTAAGDPQVAHTRDQLLRVLEHLRNVGADIQREPADQLKARLVKAGAPPVAEAFAQGERLQAPEGGSLHKADLMEQWRRAHGDRAPDTSSKEWRDLVATSRAVDASRGLAFAQGGEAAPRGSFLPSRLSGTGENIIRLMAGADRSSFLHESAHFLLEFMHDLAEREGAPDALKGDLGKIREWLGAKDGEAISREQHESFARGFEKYLMEGKAPTTALRGAFERFKRWLVDIYHSLSSLHVHLTDDVRQVFDRILASDEEIASARAEAGADVPFFADQAESGMSDAQWKAYQARVAEGVDRAKQLLEREIMAPLVEKERAAYQEERAKTRLKVADSVNQTPVFQALLVLQRGAWPDGVEIPEGAERVKLEKRDLVERYGEPALSMLPGPQVEGEPAKANRGRRLYRDDGSGIDLDTAAKLFGFRDGGELWHALVNAPDRTAEIERQTDAAMRETHADPMLDGSLHEKARVAVANDPRLEAMEREAAALALKAGRAATPSDLLKAVAKAQIGKTLARNLRPSLYRVAMERAAKKATELAIQARTATGADKARLTSEALDAKHQQLLQTHLFREASKAVEKSESNRTYQASWDDLAKRERVGKAGGWEWSVVYTDAHGAQQSEGFSSQSYGDDTAKAQAAAVARAKQIPGADVVRTGYLEQADQIREGYDLKRVSLGALQRRESLRDFIARKLAADEPVNIPQEVIADLGTKNWRDLTIDQQQAVTDALKNIDHLARIKNRFVSEGRKQSMRESIAEQVAAIAENGPKPKPEKVVGSTLAQPITTTVAQWFDSLATVARLARDMDGGKDGGVMFDAHIRALNEANDHELEMRERSIAELTKLRKEWGKITAGNPFSLRFPRFEPAVGKSMSHWARIMVALNWGNAGNRERLMKSEGWNEAQVQAVLSGLDKADMRFVQGILDHIDSYWPEIKAKQERVVGVAPEKVDATPIIHESGIYRGGYFPVVWDMERFARGAELGVDGQATLTRQGTRLYAQTKRGHTEERTQMPDGARILLDPRVITQHLNNVVHDLAFHEPLIDQSRMLNDPELRAAIASRYGVGALKQFDARLRDVAAGSAGAADTMGKVLEWARQGVNFASRAFNLVKGIQQIAGLPQAIVRVGPKYFAQSLYRMFRSPAGTDGVFKMVDEKSTMMRFRSKTFDKNIADSVAGIGLRGPVAKMVDGAGYYFWTKAFQVLDTHTWLASYLKAMDEHGGDEAKAVAIADQTVTDIQGSGLAKDIPAVMRGGPLKQVFTSNMSWWMANYNLTAEALNKARTGNPRDIMRAGSDLFILYGVQIAAWSALTAALTGKNADEWTNAVDDPGALAKSLAGDAGYTALSSMPLVRDFADALIEGKDFHGPQGLRSMSIIADAIKAIRNDREDTREVETVGRAAGTVLHLPVAAIVALAEGLAEADRTGSNPVAAAILGPRQQH